MNCSDLQHLLKWLLSFPRNEEPWNSCTFCSFHEDVYKVAQLIVVYNDGHPCLPCPFQPSEEEEFPLGAEYCSEGRQLVYCEPCSWPGGSVIMLPPCCHTAACSGFCYCPEFWDPVLRTSGEIWESSCVVLHRELGRNRTFWKFVCDIWYFGCWE